MKSVFNILIYMAILAISIEIVADFVSGSNWKDLKTELSEADDTGDSDESEDESEQEDDEWLKEKELFFEDLQPLSIAVIPVTRQKMVIVSEHPDEFHLQAPPYSPPELV